MGKLRAGLATVGVAVVVSACGTTVPAGQAASGSPNDLGGPAATTPTAGGQTDTGTTGVTPATGTTGAIAATGSTETGSADQGNTPLDTSTTSGSVATGTRKLPPIEIGTYYLSGGSEAVAASGISGLVIPDNKPLFEAMVSYLNQHGGLGGRQIKPVEFKYVEGSDPQTQDAAACAAFTQDAHVYLVIGGESSGAGGLGPCLSKHGVPLIGANTGGDARYFALNHRTIYEPGQVNFTLGLSTLVSDLHAKGLLTPGTKVGLMQYTGAVYDHAVADGLVPSLKKLGLVLNDSVSVEGLDNATIASAANSAVLKFRAEGIDRVVFMAPGGAAASYFMIAAGTQKYTPRYGIWSADSPAVTALLAPKQQLALSTGFGYQPGLDVSGSADPTGSTPQAKRCLAFWDSVGQTNNSGLINPLKRAYCDGFDTLRLAVGHSSSTLTSTAALEAGYDAIGNRFLPASTFAMRFAPGGHDIANGYRELHYDTGCSCFLYTGATKRFR